MDELGNFILAVITTNPNKVAGGTAIFTCSTVEEMESISGSLEAILDGVAHRLSDDLYIIVKH
ncbi:capping complex subunit for YIEGIA [Schinkia sp. CFF1]